jgi:hypothetical protein
MPTPVVHAHPLTPVARNADGPLAPVVMALAPASAAVGDPSFSLRVLGAGFDANAVIVFAGQDEPTAYFSEGELVTGMHMPLWQGPDTLACLVRNPDGQESNTLTFDLQPPRAVPLDPAAPSKPSPLLAQI